MTPRIVRALEILAEGPATSSELGMELNLSPSRIDALLAVHLEAGQVVSRPFPHPHPPTANPVRLYALANYSEGIAA